MLNKRYTAEQANKFLRLNFIDKIKLNLIDSNLKKTALIYNQSYIEVFFRISVGLQDFLESLGYEIILESDCMIFNKKDKRQLLNG
jgi:beta-xylosidase